MANMPPAPKRKPGRPKGSKNKKTLEREALAAAAAAAAAAPREAGDGRRARKEQEDAGARGHAGGPKQTAPTDEKGVEKD